MELARGQIADRPWGRTLAAIGLRGVACEVVLHAPDGKEYRIAFLGEGVVAASSPFGADSALQIALTHRYAQTAHIPFIHHKLGADPDLDELEIIAEIARLDADQAMRMRLRAIAQCATRTFAIPDGIFTVQSDITLPVREDAAVDIRAIVYAGVRTHWDADRLLAEVHRFGTHFTLKPQAADDLGQFGFQRAERDLLEPLLVGCNLEELESLHAQVPPATVRAAVYALVSCGAVTASEPIAFTRAPTPTETAIPIMISEPTTRARPPTATSEHVVGDLMDAPDTLDRPALAPSARLEDPEDPASEPPASGSLYGGRRSAPPSHRPARASAPPPIPSGPMTVPEFQLPARSELADVLTSLDTDQGMSQLPVLPETNDLADLALSPSSSSPPTEVGAAGDGGAVMLDDAEEPPAAVFTMPPPMHVPPAPLVGLGELIANEIGTTEAPPPSLLPEVEQFAPEDRLRRATRPPPTKPPYQPAPSDVPPGWQPAQPPGVWQGQPPGEPPGVWQGQPAGQPPGAWQGQPPSAWPGQPPGQPPGAWQPPPAQPWPAQPDPQQAPWQSPAQPSGHWPPQPQPQTEQPAIGRTRTPPSIQPPTAPAPAGRPPIVPAAHKPMPRSGVHTSPPPRSGAATSPPRSGASSTAPPSIASKVAGLPVGGGPHIPPADEANSGVILPQSRGPAKTPQQQAAEHTKLGMIHLRDGQLTKAVEELQRATDLDSNDADNYARLAWAKFCAATDKKVAAVAARKVLGHAVHKSLKPEIALFYLGRVERMCGRDREALEHFQQVVSNEPKHAEALAEIRVIERTLAAEKAASSGIGGLFKKKK